MLDDDIGDAGANLLLQAEMEWYDNRACLTAEFNPPDLNVKPGESEDFDVTVRHRLENVEVPMHLKTELDVTCSGAVAPSEADFAPPAPARFTYTAGPECSSASRVDGFFVEGVSKRGRVRDVVEDVSKKRPPLPRLWSGTVDGTSHQSGIPVDVTDSWHAQVTFTLVSQSSGQYHYEPSGTISYTTSGDINGCSISGNGTHTLDPPDGFLELLDRTVGTPPAERIDYYGSGLNELGVNDGPRRAADNGGLARRPALVRHRRVQAGAEGCPEPR